MDDLLFDLERLSLGRKGNRHDFTTSDVSLISHVHGRQRREERGIARRELQVVRASCASSSSRACLMILPFLPARNQQDAVKKGRCEVANPGRDGSVRYKFIYKGRGPALLSPPFG